MTHQHMKYDTKNGNDTCKQDKEVARPDQYLYAGTEVEVTQWGLQTEREVFLTFPSLPQVTAETTRIFLSLQVPGAE